MPAPQEKVQIPVVASSVALGFIVLCLIVYILNVASAIMIPFVIAVFVWYLINALARLFGKASFGGKHLPKFLCFFVAILSLALGMTFIFELISHNISKVVQAAPVYQHNFEKIIPKIVDLFHLDYAPTIRDLFNYIDLGATMTLMARLFTGFAGKTLVVMLYVGFLLYEQRFFKKKINEIILDKKKEERIHLILKNIDVKVQRYIGVKSFVSAIDSVLTFIILSLFNVDFAGFWGLLAFFLHFIPYAGSFVAIALPSMIALIQHGNLTDSFVVLATLSTSHAFIGHMLDPYLMGRSLNLSPIFIISSLAMWGMIWGIPGMFLAVPILAMLMITLSQFHKTRPIAILLSKTGAIDGEVPEKPAARGTRPVDAREAI